MKNMVLEPQLQVTRSGTGNAAVASTLVLNTDIKKDKEALLVNKLGQNARDAGTQS